VILLLTGTDQFSRSEALQALKAQHDSDGSLAANTTTLNAASLALNELRSAASTVPFLADYRLVVVEGLGGRFGTRGGGRRTRDLGEWEGLTDLLMTLPEATLLIFTDDELTAANPIRQIVEAAGEVRDFPIPRERELGPWLRRRAQAAGLKLEQPAERLLVDLIGRNTGVLASEVDKLKTYAGDAAVSEEDVRALVARAREANIFRLVDAVAEGQVTVALQALELLRSEGETPPRLISMIARQFRMIVIAREVLDGGGAAAQVREVLKVQEFVARRAVDQARRFSQSTADAAMRRILQCDVEIQDYWQARPGGVQQDLAVELLVADLCGVRAPAAAAH